MIIDSVEDGSALNVNDDHQPGSKEGLAILNLAYLGIFPLCD